LLALDGIGQFHDACNEVRFAITAAVRWRDIDVVPRYYLMVSNTKAFHDVGLPRQPFFGRRRQISRYAFPSGRAGDPGDGPRMVQTLDDVAKERKRKEITAEAG
jgi:hypothetical protein